jgi:hypothetical protein
MATLILQDAEGHEVGRELIQATARFGYYHACQADELITHAGRRYTIVTVCWRIPEEEVVCGVRFHSWAPEPDGSGL